MTDEVVMDARRSEAGTGGSTVLKAYLDRRVAEDTMIAQGDNCEGR